MAALAHGPGSATRYGELQEGRALTAWSVLGCVWEVRTGGGGDLVKWALLTSLSAGRRSWGPLRTAANRPPQQVSFFPHPEGSCDSPPMLPLNRGLL